MKSRQYIKWLSLLILVLVLGGTVIYASGGGGHADINFPPALESYHDSHLEGVLAKLGHRVEANMFNLVGSVIFLLAIIHTFLTGKLRKIAHDMEHKRKHAGDDNPSIIEELLHFVGEVEAVFGLWALVLGAAIIYYYDLSTLTYYLSQKVNYTEPLFIVVIMTLAATRPILKLSEILLEKVANLLGGTITAWWFTILTIGPMLGSFITEPAAMTIAAMLLAAKFYSLKPNPKLAYATIGLLFVNVSVGGTLTHFAAPPVLMVAAPWGWDLTHMLTHFGWKAVLGILIANGLYFAFFRKDLNDLQQTFSDANSIREKAKQFFDAKSRNEAFEELEKLMEDDTDFQSKFKDHLEEIRAKWKIKYQNRTGLSLTTETAKAFDDAFDHLVEKEKQKRFPHMLAKGKRLNYRDPDWDTRDDAVPVWVILIHIFFLGLTVYFAHYPAIFIAGFLFFLGFAKATYMYQNRTDLKPALLVGFFLAGLVIHGGVQSWWIAPVLGGLSDVPLMLIATTLTAFNDNAAITFLSTLVPGFSDSMKYAVVAGAVTGGGLTVIANAPNPAGQSILNRFFENGVNPINLLKAAIIPTIVMGLCFMLIR